MQQQQRKRSLSLAAGKLSFSGSYSMRPKSSGLELRVQEEQVWNEQTSATTKASFFPIKRTGESVRRLLRRASQSFKFHPNSNGKLLMFPNSDKKSEKEYGSMKSLSEGKAVNSDSESGFCQDDNDCFYASDTLAVRRGMSQPAGGGGRGTCELTAFDYFQTLSNIFHPN